LLRLSRLLALREKDLNLSLLAEAKVENRPVDGIKVVAKGHQDVSLYFDRETGLLVKLERRRKIPAIRKEAIEKESMEERILSDYRPVDGVQSPRKTVIYLDGKRLMDAEVVDVKFLEKLDDSVFARP